VVEGGGEEEEEERWKRRRKWMMRMTGERNVMEEMGWKNFR